MNPIVSCSGWGDSSRVGTPPDVAMADMSDGGYVGHTCGVAASDGHMECWGQDHCNRVSDAPTTGAYSFTSVGGYSSCVIVHTTATASCWGCTNGCMVFGGNRDRGQCDVRCPVLFTLTNSNLNVYATRHYRRQSHAANIMDSNTLYCDCSAFVAHCLMGCGAVRTLNLCVHRVCCRRVLVA